MVEADGEWHTTDNKYASDDWRATHPLLAPAPAKREPSPMAKPTSAAEVVHVLDDSDEEDEGRVKRELSPTYRNGHATSSFSSLDGTLPPQSQTPTISRQGSKVIDLTEDSDDEDMLPQTGIGVPVAPRSMLSAAALPARSASLSQRLDKRKAPDDGYSPPESTWKRARASNDASSSPHRDERSPRGPGLHLPPLPGVSYPHGYARRASPDAYRYRSPPQGSDFSGFTSVSSASRASTVGSYRPQYPNPRHSGSRASDAASSRWNQ
jgi:E3 SUMO-protein ligase PIAS1